jgi:hypothetical protein
MPVDWRHRTACAVPLRWMAPDGLRRAAKVGVPDGLRRAAKVDGTGRLAPCR